MRLHESSLVRFGAVQSVVVTKTTRFSTGVGEVRLSVMETFLFSKSEINIFREATKFKLDDLQ